MQATRLSKQAAILLGVFVDKFTQALCFCIPVLPGTEV